MNAITTFATPTEYVGRTPYCTATRKAVWLRRPNQMITAEAGRKMVEGFESAYAGSTLPHSSHTYREGAAEVTVIGSGSRWNVIAIRGDEAMTMVAGCECHAKEVAQHLAKIA